MQASRSNNAYELLNPEMKSDPQPGSSFTRSLPSPFSAPIQAARKYLERQRGDAWQIGAQEAESVGHGPLRPREEPPAREQGSREQDRRLERSLYEGHSTEAGPNFEPSVGGDAGSGAERTHLAESDGSEPLFPYAITGTVPDPDAVRGAILRLARESELRRETACGAAKDATWDSAGTKVAEAKSLGLEAPQPLNFSDVARRVWGTHASLSGEVEHGVLACESIAKEAALAVPMQNETEIPGGGEVQAIAGVPCAPHQKEIASGQNGAFPQWKAAQTLSPKEAAAPEMESALVPPSAEGVECVVEQEPALAHDACNLLSALALYSELLASPGVLGERYLHYAGELRLIAGRSQALIDRLLRTAAARTEKVCLSDGQLRAAAAGDGIAADLLSNLASSGDDVAATTQRTGASLSSDAAFPLPLAEDVTYVVQEVGPHLVETDLRPHPVGRSVSERALSTANPAEANGPAEGTSLVDLLMRWGSLLSTLSHGTLEVVFGPKAATPVPAEAEALERILVNLVRNARAAIVEGGAIRISVKEIADETLRGDTETSNETGSGQDVVQPQDLWRGIGISRTMVLTVDDSGCGMTEGQVRRALGENADLDGIVLPVDDAAHHGGRQGLGLRIVRELVAASGGKLFIQSCPGRGTRIEIRWPLGAVAAPATSAIEAKNGPSDEAAETPPAVPQATPSIANTRHQVAPVEGTKQAARPDGFSEVELRAMMLRLHRTGPQERSPLSRRLTDRQGETQEARRRFGAVGIGAEGAPADRPSQKDTAAKGAIAC